MSTEITIFDIPEKSITIDKSQKEIEYDDLKRDSSMQDYHFDTFYEMEMRSSEYMIPKSNIVSILCKYVMKYCMPVVSDKYHITLQNEQATKVYNASTNKYHVVPTNTQFNLSGVRIPIIFARVYDKHMLSSFDHMTNVDMANNGCYGLRDYQTRRFTQQRLGFTQPGLPSIEAKNNIVYFVNETDAVKKLTILIDFIKYMELYYNENYLTVLTDMHIAPYTPNYINDGTAQWLIKSNIKTQNLVKSLLPSMTGTIGKSFSWDLFLTLQQNNLLHAYNVGNTIGIHDKLFKKEITAAADLLNFKKEREIQRKLGFTQKLQLAKRRAIAFNKYNQDDLGKLNKKQLAIIQLEYNKLQKNLDKDQSLSAKQNQKLFFRLRKSFLDLDVDRLKSAIQIIRKEISSKELNGNTLIEGGVCPHVYQKGSTILKHFGKPWLNTQLTKDVVQEYALPSERTGYFCYICGEHLADADNEGEVRFVGGERVVHNRIDDPLQTMIWKEAMYTISTYIKFNTPIPIKPLVSSIARGLRNVIGEQEAKLFRSRTTTADSIKDTLNLYASIYVYAVLCGMMIVNPNKMLFGRDKPTKSAKPDFKSKSKFKKPTTQEQSKYVADKLVDTGSKVTTALPTRAYVNPSIALGAGEVTDIGLSPFAETQQVQKVQREAQRKSRRAKKAKSIKRKMYSGGKTTNDVKLYERFILTTALNLVLVTKDSIIKKLTYINVDVIKQIFLKTAYPWAKRYSKPIKMSERSDIQFTNGIKDLIETDSFYSYLYLAKRFSDKDLKITSVKKVLGRSIEKLNTDLEDGIRLYATMKKPLKWSFGNKLFDDYSYRSFETSFEYLEQELYLKPFVPMHLQVVKYHEDTADVLKIEKKYHRKLAANVVRPMFKFELLNDIQSNLTDYRPSKLELASHYCPNGKQHNNQSFVYKTPAGKTVELTTKEINKWITSNNVEKLAWFSTIKLIDEKCSNCKKHVRFARSKQTRDKTLITTFTEIDDILAFYQYYTTRCPVGDLHDIVSNVCKKCKINTTHPHDTADAYYTKYIGKFKQIEREKQALAIQSLKQALDENNASNTYTKSIDFKTTTSYKSTMQKIAEWSQLAGVKYNIIANIGLNEGVKMADIKASRVNPSKNDLSSGAYMTQAIKIKSYILQILRDYSMLMNHENIVGLPLYLKEILAAQSKVQIKDLHKSMPQVTDEFIKLDEKYRYTLPHKSYANFLLEYLAGLMVSINNDSAKQYKLMAKMLITNFTKNILKQDNLFSKAESIFSKKKAIIDAEDNLTDEAVSGDEYTGYKTDESIGEFSEDKTIDYKPEIANFADAYDVENAAAIWDLD